MKQKGPTDRRNHFPQPAQLSINLYCYTCNRYRDSISPLKCAQTHIRSEHCKKCQGSLEIQLWRPSQHQHLFQHTNRHAIKKLKPAGTLSTLPDKVEEYASDTGMTHLSISGPGTIEPTSASRVVDTDRTRGRRLGHN